MENNGESAFPYTGYNEHHGMTLRDYFAAKAMQSLVPLRSTKQVLWNELAQSAYEMASAMMVVRGENN